MWQQFIIIKNKILLIQSSRNNTTNVVGLPGPDIGPHMSLKGHAQVWNHKKIGDF